MQINVGTKGNKNPFDERASVLDVLLGKAFVLALRHETILCVFHRHMYNQYHAGTGKQR